MTKLSIRFSLEFTYVLNKIEALLALHRMCQKALVQIFQTAVFMSSLFVLNFSYVCICIYMCVHACACVGMYVCVHVSGRQRTTSDVVPQPLFS